ncbi:MAG: NfeD family protein [Chloroflexota bacterium]|nr:NfeD family protein [Chloroflexota bacterium]
MFQINPDLFRVDTWFIIVLVIVVIAFTAISIIWGIRAHRKPVSVGREDLIGRTAVVDTALGPKGMVLVEGERWRAILDEGHAEPEEEVIITKVEGLKLWVTKKETA